MDNVTFMIKGCQAGAYKKKEWVLALFCVSDLPTEKSPNHYPFKIYQHDNKPCFFKSDYDETAEPDDREYISINGKIIDYSVNPEPIVVVNANMTIYKGDIPNLKVDELTTTPGVFFINWYTLVYALRDIVPYENGPKLDLTSIAAKYAKIVIDDPEDPAQKDLSKVYVSDIKSLLRSIGALSAFSIINAPAATPYTMTPAPGIQEKKKELLAKYKDKLHDPTVVAAIEKELINYDREYLSKDPHGGFYIGSKGINVVRKKLHTMQGLVHRLDPSKPPELVDGSLNDPMNVDQFPAIMDSMRDGSFSRGSMTALGGEAVKFIYRIYSAAEIIKEDCGTTLGVRRTITEFNYKRYIGSYLIVNGKDLLLDSGNINSYIGKEVIVRSPAYCKADPEGRGYCNKCFGESMRGYEKSLASYGAQVASQMNGRFMGAMHSQTTTATKLNLESSIT